MNLRISQLTVRRERHPFPVVAWFDRVIAVSFSFPEEVLRPLVLEPLELDSYHRHGFVTAALVWTRGLRPAGFPAFLGQDFFWQATEFLPSWGMIAAAGCGA